MYLLQEVEILWPHLIWVFDQEIPHVVVDVSLGVQGSDEDIDALSEPGRGVRWSTLINSLITEVCRPIQDILVPVLNDDAGALVCFADDDGMVPLKLFECDCFGLGVNGRWRIVASLEGKSEMYVSIDGVALGGSHVDLGLNGGGGGSLSGGEEVWSGVWK